MSQKKKKEDEDDDSEYEIEFKDEKFSAGESLQVSKTFLPNAVMLDDSQTLLVDFPGFSDTTCGEVRMGMDMAFRSVMKLANTVRPLALMDVNAMNVERGQVVRKQLNKMTRLMPPEDGYSLLLGATKVDKRFTTTPKKLLRNLQEVVAQTVPNWSDNVANMSDFMNLDCSTDELTKQAKKFRGELSQKAHKPREVFSSDCLSASDSERFQKALESSNFNAMFESAVYALIDPGNLMGCKGKLDQQHDDVMKDFGDVEAKPEMSEDEWAGHIEKMEQMADVICEFAKRAIHQRDVMRDTKKTWAQSLFPVLDDLDKLGQPRIKKLLVAADIQLMQSQQLQLLRMAMMMRQVLGEVGSAGYDADFGKAKTKMEAVMQKQNEHFRSLGYKDAEGALAQQCGVDKSPIALGAGACGTVAMVAYVAATGCMLVAVPVVAAVSIGPLAYGVLGWGVIRIATRQARKDSSKLATLIIRSLDAIEEGTDAFQSHSAGLTAEGNRMSQMLKDNLD